MTRETSDQDIREAMHRKILKSHHINPTTLVVDELGVSHGRKRVDIAVLNGQLHGYEIKSSKDNLKRLEDQILAFERVFHKLTLIAAPAHIDSALRILPDWCGVIEARKGARGAIHFRKIRSAVDNVHVDPFEMAHLLWKGEVLDILSSTGSTVGSKYESRNRLYKYLVDHISADEVYEQVKLKLSNRENWRVVG